MRSLIALEFVSFSSSHSCVCSDWMEDGSTIPTAGLCHPCPASSEIVHCAETATGMGRFALLSACSCRIQAAQRQLGRVL
jgi:hypothetical protein